MPAARRDNGFVSLMAVAEVTAITSWQSLATCRHTRRLASVLGTRQIAPPLTARPCSSSHARVSAASRSASYSR
jgi:hypothetical protein